MPTSVLAPNGNGATNEPVGYPDGLDRLPKLLERIEGVRFDLDELVTLALELGDEADRLSRELGDLATFVDVRVEINRARERRRVRHRRHRNGHVPAGVLEVTR